jgi:hypothetical protein
MMLPPAVILHGVADFPHLRGEQALTLLSPPGAGSFAGARWWLAVLRRLREELPALSAYPFLDCGEDGAAALEAIHWGVPGLILAPAALGWSECAALCRRHGLFLLKSPPPAWDLALLRFVSPAARGRHEGGVSPPCPPFSPPHDR